MSKLYNVMTQTETECVIIDEGVTKYQAEYLRYWHSETLGKTYHWKEPMILGDITPDPVGFDLETLERNEFEEDRANHDARATWVDRAGTKRVVAIGDETGVTQYTPEMVDWEQSDDDPYGYAADMALSCGGI